MANKICSYVLFCCDCRNVGYMWRIYQGYLGLLHWNPGASEVTLKDADKIDQYETCVTITWWRHQMGTFSALLAICAGNSPVTGEFPHKGQWRGALMFSLICARTNGWVNNREAGDLRRHRAHYDVIVMNQNNVPTLWSLVAPQLVVMTTWGTARVEKVGIMIIVGFQLCMIIWRSVLITKFVSGLHPSKFQISNSKMFIVILIQLNVYNT